MKYIPDVAQYFYSSVSYQVSAYRTMKSYILYVTLRPGILEVCEMKVKGWSWCGIKVLSQ